MVELDLFSYLFIYSFHFQFILNFLEVFLDLISAQLYGICFIRVQLEPAVGHDVRHHERLELSTREFSIARKDRGTLARVVP